MVNNGGGYMLIASHLDHSSSMMLNELDDEVNTNNSQVDNSQNQNNNSNQNNDDNIDNEIFPQFVSDEDVMGNSIYKILRWSNVWNDMKTV